MSKERYFRIYKDIEALYNRSVTELDCQRAWDRYKKIVEIE
jgi:uncharacterized protein YktA (UPF0223 family)